MVLKIVLIAVSGHLLNRPISIAQTWFSENRIIENGINRAIGRIVRYVLGGVQVLSMQYLLHKRMTKPPMFIAVLSFVLVGIGTVFGYLVGWVWVYKLR